MPTSTQTKPATEPEEPAQPAASAPADDQITIHRPARKIVTREETRERMLSFASERKEAFIAAVRKGKN